MQRPKLIIVGHARHGKDTVCELLAKHGYAWQSSSWLCGQIAVWPAIQEQWNEWRYGKMYNPDHPDPAPTIGPYDSFEEAFNDRANHREFWYNCIKAYNTPDETRLAREIFAQSNIYCGMRRFEELSACQDQNVCDLVVWVDASKRVGPEPKSSCTIQPFQAHHILDNNGTLEELADRVNKLYTGFLQPWETRLNSPSCPHCGFKGTLNDNELTNTKWCQACGKTA